MGRNKWLIARGAIVLIVFFIAIKGHGTLLKTIWQKWHEAKSLQIQIEEVRSWQQVTAKLQEENNNIQARITAIADLSPQEEALSATIEFLQNRCTQTGIKLVFIRPQAPEKIASYQRLPYEVGLTGTYHKLGAFLFALESSEYIIEVENITIATKNMLDRNLDITLIVSVFFSETADSQPTNLENE